MVEAHGVPEEFLTFGNVVNGRKVTSERSIFTGTNPRDGKDLWEVPVANEEDVEDAIKAASQAFVTWSTTTFEQRSKVLIEWADKIKENRESLVPLIEVEGGKPVCSSTYSEAVY